MEQGLHPFVTQVLGYHLNKDAILSCCSFALLSYNSLQLTAESGTMPGSLDLLAE